MERKKITLLIWLVISLSIFAKYFWDKMSIQCEPCLPGIECPPCHTRFMKNFWWYFVGWNVLAATIWKIVFNRKENGC